MLKNLNFEPELTDGLTLEFEKNKNHTTNKKNILMSTKTKYSDAELQEFRTLIEEKIQKAQLDLDLLKSSYMNNGNNGTEDTAPTF